MSDFQRPPLVDTQIIPVLAGTDPRFDRRGQWNDDRAGRLVVVGLVFALAFLLVAAAIWWANGGRGTSNDSLASDAPTISPVTAPVTVVDQANATADASTLALSPAPMPAQGLVMSAATQAVPPPPAPADAAPPPPATEAPAPVATAAETTTTLAATTTTIAPTTTVSRATTTLASSTTAPATSVAALPATTAPPAPTSTTTAPSSTSTTAAPATTVPAPVVTSPASVDATLLDVVNDTPDLSRVRELVQMSGFAPELDAARHLTFLAPSNAAIEAWSATPEGEAVLADPDAVYDLLLRHLVAEAVEESTIFTRSSLSTVSGAQLVVRQQSRTVDGADLLVVDVTAANGLLHVVSDVLTGA